MKLFDAHNDLPEIERRLGLPLAVFQSPGGPRWLVPFRRFPWIAVGATAVVILGVLFSIFEDSSRAKISSPELAKGIVLGLFLIAAIGTAFLVAARHRSFRVQVHENGLARMQEEDCVAVAWDEIAVVEFEVYTYGEGQLIEQISQAGRLMRLRLKGGHVLEFSNWLPGQLELTKLIQERTLPRLLEEAWSAYRAGEPVNFRKASVGQDGLRCGETLYPWSDIREIEFKNGQVYLRKHGKRLFGCVPWQEQHFANAHVFKAMVQKIVKSEEPATENT
jgi:hypothetical protein